MLNLIGIIGFLILLFESLFLILIIRKRVYVQFYLTFSCFVATALTFYIYFSHVNKLYSFIAILLSYVSLFLPSVFVSLKLNFLNTIIRIVADIYREVLLIGISSKERQKRIDKEKTRTQAYWQQIADETEAKYNKEIGE